MLVNWGDNNISLAKYVEEENGLCIGKLDLLNSEIEQIKQVKFIDNSTFATKQSKKVDIWAINSDSQTKKILSVKVKPEEIIAMELSDQSDRLISILTFKGIEMFDLRTGQQVVRCVIIEKTD